MCITVEHFQIEFQLQCCRRPAALYEKVVKMISIIQLKDNWPLFLLPYNEQCTRSINKTSEQMKKETIKSLCNQCR